MRSADRTIATLSGLTVDEGRGKMYLLSGHKVYEASMIAAKPQAAPETGSQPGSEQPAAKPTAEP
jgi:hypothetical protein